MSKHHHLSGTGHSGESHLHGHGHTHTGGDGHLHVAKGDKAVHHGDKGEATPLHAQASELLSTKPGGGKHSGGTEVASAKPGKPEGKDIQIPPADYGKHPLTTDSGRQQVAAADGREQHPAAGDKLHTKSLDVPALAMAPLATEALLRSGGNGNSGNGEQFVRTAAPLQTEVRSTAAQPVDGTVVTPAAAQPESRVAALPTNPSETRVASAQPDVTPGAQTQAQPEQFVRTAAALPAGDLQPTPGMSNLDSTRLAAAGAGNLDASRSISDMMNSGQFKAGDRPVTTDATLQPGQAPKVQIEYQNLDNGVQHSQPNYVVNKDGSVTVVRSPEGADGKIKDANIVIQVAREPGDTNGPTAAQKQALDNLVAYQGDRIKDQFGSQLQDVPLKDGSTVKQVDITDPAHIVSDKTMNGLGENIPPEKLGRNAEVQPEIQHRARRIADQVGRTGGSDGGSSVVRGRDANDAFGDQTPIGRDPVSAVADTIGSLDANKDHPYQTVHQNSDGSYNVGRYGFNHHNFTNFLANHLSPDILAMINNPPPPDWSRLSKILKDHPEMMKEFQDSMQQAAKDGSISQDFAKKMQDPKNIEGLGQFIETLKGGHGAPTQDQINTFMPKDNQDLMAQAMIKDYAKQMNIDPSKMGEHDPGKLALAHFLGRPPSQQELGNPNYQQYMTAADNMYHIAQARQSGPGDILVHGENGKIAAVAADMVGQQLWAQTKYRNAVEGGNLGCAASVSKVLQQSGYSYIDSAGVSGVAQQAKAHGWREEAGISNARPGDIIYGLGGSHGHIGIVGQNGKMYDNFSSDGRWHEENIRSSYIVRHFGSAVRIIHPPA